MRKVVLLNVLISFLFLLPSCKEEISYLPISIPKDMKFLGHKGSGIENSFGNTGLQENTWKSIANAMNTLDGSEIDIQMSADSTFWIFHDNKIKTCIGKSINLTTLTDVKIKEANNCNYDRKLMQLDEFLIKSNSETWDNKTICLDLKVLHNSETLLLLGGVEKSTIFVRDQLNALLNRSNIKLNVIFEVFNRIQYQIFDSIFQNETFLVKHSPSARFIQEMSKTKLNLSLPIYKLSDYNDSISSNIWSVNTANQFIEGLKYNPKIIQGDNLPLMQFFKSIQKDKKALLSESLTESIRTKDKEFHQLLDVKLPLEKELLIEFKSLDKNLFPKEVLFVFQAKNSSGKTVHWQSVDLNEKPHSYFFIDPEFLAFKNAKTVHVLIWNKSKSSLNHTYRLSQYELD